MVNVGDRFESTDARRGTRVGEVLSVRAGKARMCWGDGSRSTVSVERLSNASGGSRSYLRLPRLPKEDGPQRARNGERWLYTIAKAIRGGRPGHRVWSCSWCHKERQGLGPWIVILFRRDEGKSRQTLKRARQTAVVCGQSCRRAVVDQVNARRGIGNEAAS